MIGQRRKPESDCEAEPEWDATTNEPRIDLVVLYFYARLYFYKDSRLFPCEIVIDLNQTERR